MRILQLHSENVKRIKAIDITPAEDVIVLSGKNGQGKTSVLDSIWMALEYRAGSKGNPNPLRVGETKGQVMLDLGDYIVTRKFTPEGTTLEIKTPDGSKISSPQKLLDGMIGDLSFDPWEFSRKTEKEQRQMLSDVLFAITKGQLDLAGYDQKHANAFAQRTEANRERKRVATLLTTMAPPTADDPTDEVSSEDLTKSISNVLTEKSRLDGLLMLEKQTRERITRLETDLIKEKATLDNLTAELSSAPEIPDIEFLKSELRNIETRNKRAREVRSYSDLRKSLTEIDESISALNDSMELIEIEKAEALEASPLPVTNLRIDAEGIMVLNEANDPVPFCQASAAQRLRISLAIAMAANPKLRVIRIADGSLLDDTSMQIVRDMAGAQDFQIWIEYASRNDQDRMGVYIEDGQVVSLQGQNAP